MIDSLIYEGLTDTATMGPMLKSADGTWRVWPSGTLGYGEVPATPEYPYVQHGDGGSNTVLNTRGTRHSLVMYWDVYAYDEGGSYLRIKTILNQAKDNLERKAGLITADGWSATEIVHTSYSPDGYDTVRHQLTKRASFRIVASRSL